MPTRELWSRRIVRLPYRSDVSAITSYRHGSPEPGLRPCAATPQPPHTTGERWRRSVRLSGSCLRDLVRQFECVFLVLLECRQDLLCKLFQFSVMARALLLLEEIHGLIVICDHLMHVLLVKSLAVQGLNIFSQPLVLCVERLWHSDPQSSANGGQLLTYRRLIPDHVIGEALDVGVLRFLGEFAKLDLGHAADGGLFDERPVFLAQRVLRGRRRAGGIGLARLRIDRGC